MKNIDIVIGLGFGDEGKGLAVSYLCNKNENSIVIRFNGGQQAGHTVVLPNGNSHVFSNFGAGSLQNIPTYWSQYCTFAPGNLLKEYNALKQLTNTPTLFIDNLCLVTTHYDVLYNRLLEQARNKHKHGSCGMGFGATIERGEKFFIKLFAMDLKYYNVTKHKLQLIANYYQKKISNEFPEINFNDFEHEKADLVFFNSIERILELEQNKTVTFVSEIDFFSKIGAYNAIIFEGAQGILLDMDFGFFPHVTRSNTTSKNVAQLIGKINHLSSYRVNKYYVTRAYQNRHGQGPINYEQFKVPLINNRLETNIFNPHQGAFRVAPLDINLLNFALHCDSNFIPNANKNLIITCLDQVPEGKIVTVINNKPIHMPVCELKQSLHSNFNAVLLSHNNCGFNILKL